MSNDGWVSVTKRLPPVSGSYWVATVSGDVHLGYMKPDGSGFRRKDVVAWKPYPPTPEPPKFIISLVDKSSDEE